MAKFDVESAYRKVPVHPLDRYLLGMKWRNQYYVDLTLPFGLRSAPFIFNAIADSVEWILMHSYQISALLHYLDDFITAGPADSMQCAHNLSTVNIRSLQAASLASPPGEMRRPHYGAGGPGNRIRFSQPSCPPASRQVRRPAGHDKVVAPT